MPQDPHQPNLIGRSCGIGRGEKGNRGWIGGEIYFEIVDGEGDTWTVWVTREWVFWKLCVWAPERMVGLTHVSGVETTG